MSNEKDEALSLILLEMQMWLAKYDTDSEIFKELVEALKIWGVELDVITTKETYLNKPNARTG